VNKGLDQAGHSSSTLYVSHTVSRESSVSLEAAASTVFQVGFLMPAFRKLSVQVTGKTLYG
jgi:hypothetical protein